MEQQKRRPLQQHQENVNLTKKKNNLLIFKFPISYKCSRKWIMKNVFLLFFSNFNWFCKLNKLFNTSYRFCNLNSYQIRAKIIISVFIDPTICVNLEHIKMPLGNDDYSLCCRIGKLSYKMGRFLEYRHHNIIHHQIMKVLELICFCFAAILVRFFFFFEKKNEIKFVNK